MDPVKLELLKNKDEHAQSAVASQEVRQHLAGFIRSKIRAGSSSQIKGASQPSTSQQPLKATTSASNCVSTTSALATATDTSESSSKYEDHPLRKTASMPTIHTPYKAQSLSRRRQVERRTTMSPLMRRKTKPRRALLHSQDSNSTEYSSNPCIVAHSIGFPSSSRSSSPLPLFQRATTFDVSGQPAASQAHHAEPASGQQPFATCRYQQHQQQTFTSQQSAIPAPVQSGPRAKLSSKPSNSEAEDFSFEHSKISSGLSGGSFQSFNHLSFAPSHMVAPVTTASSQGNLSNFMNVNTPFAYDNNCQAPLSSKQKQHMKVNEAIRKTVFRRASQKSRLGPGGSLDIENLANPATASNVANPVVSLRQRSVDNADIKTCAGLNSIPSMSPMIPGIFSRYRFGTTSDAASLRRSQSPSSSISMGQAATQTSAAASVVLPSLESPVVAHQIASWSRDSMANRPGRAVGMQARNYSSSSSSTLSLLSQQDSLEDSSSQAIDLSSSAETNRTLLQQHYQDHQRALVIESFMRQINAKGHKHIYATQEQQLVQQYLYQKAIQETNFQLQLCQAQDEMNQLMLSSSHASKQETSSQEQHQRPEPMSVDPSDSCSSFGSQTCCGHDAAKQLQMANSADNNHLGHLRLLAQSQELAASEPFGALGSLAPQSQMLQQPATLTAAHQMHLSLAQAQPLHSAISDGIQQWLLVFSSLFNPAEAYQAISCNTRPLMDDISLIPEAWRVSLFNHFLTTQHIIARPTSGILASAAPKHPQASAIFSSPYYLPNALLVSKHLYHEYLLKLYQSMEQKYARSEFSKLLVTDQVIVGVTLAMEPSIARTKTELEILSRTFAEVPASTTTTNNNINNSKDNGDTARPTTGGGDITALDGTTLDLSLPAAKSTGKDAEIRALESLVVGANETRPNFKYDREPPFANDVTKFVGFVPYQSTSRTGIVYNLNLCRHKCICLNEDNHPENGRRVLAIWRRLQDRGLLAKCYHIEPRLATLDELRLCHSETYVNYFGRNAYERVRMPGLDLRKLPIDGLTQLECGGQGADVDTAWNEELTPANAQLAVGFAIEAAELVFEGQLRNAFAVIRPPGHHAEYEHAIGFCFFNSVAIAAKLLISRRRVSRILIVDWDVHHGNGIQKAFYEDKNVMYISLHRFDGGNFFPGTGSARELGAGPGEGYNWNIAWSGPAMGDAEYMAAFRSLVMPVAREFKPSMVLVACGFDAAVGHSYNFGGYSLSPACFAYMTRQLTTLANGKVVLCLEGGYQLLALADCAECCLRALLGQVDIMDFVLESELRRRPCKQASDTLHEVVSLAAKYWPSVEGWRDCIDLSAFEAVHRCR